MTSNLIVLEIGQEPQKPRLILPWDLLEQNSIFVYLKWVPNFFVPFLLVQLIYLNNGLNIFQFPIFCDISHT